MTGLDNEDQIRFYRRFFFFLKIIFLFNIEAKIDVLGPIPLKVEGLEVGSDFLQFYGTSVKIKDKGRLNITDRIV